MLSGKKKTKGLNVRWKYFKLTIEEEIKQYVPLRERMKPNNKIPLQARRVCRSVKKQIQRWKIYAKLVGTKNVKNIRGKEIKTTGSEEKHKWNTKEANERQTKAFL